jgi:hypothetical protein
MNMPGFTAETSLYKTKVNYHAPRQQEQAGGLVHPAMPNILTPRPAVPPPLDRPVPWWYPYVIKPLCRVIIKEYGEDPLTGEPIAELCEKHCSDGSVRPWPCKF